MLQTILAKVIGTRNEREMKRLMPLVARIGELEASAHALTDGELAAKTVELRTRVSNGESLETTLPEAFTVVREAGSRILGMRHFDVQLIGGMILHNGKIAEMKTGEGKTLVATLPAYLNSLEMKGVHVVTVNDYLAKRDAEWMGQLYRFLGLSVGVIQHDLGDRERQEARTPLIISGPSEESVERYYSIDKIIPRLKRGATVSGHQTQEEREELEETGDYIVDEKARTATLTESGIAHAEKLLGVGNLYDPANMETLHAVNQALRAHVLFKKDVDYMLKDGEVVIVDEFTGRLMPGRRWSDGLHQAVESKEGVKIERENQTLATITFQNYFRMYDKLAGMTGTADTEAVEFDKIYKLEVFVAPTNRSLIRKEFPDLVYQTETEKFDAVVEEIAECQERGQPTLVGTVSIEKSERLSGLLKRKGIKHVVLNARYHAQEAEIVAQAGRLGAATIATNMAGRGTDILLGGNPEFLAKQRLLSQGIDPAQAPDEARRAELGTTKVECASEHDKVVALGGLHIIGTERHEARRIDNQLRGRAGRQGDPGSSRFYLSLEDDLMRIFGGERLKSFMARLNIEEGVPIESPLVTRSIERAQKQVEQRNFETRKHLLEYDDVMNKQRTEIYTLRRELLAGSDQAAYIMDKARDILEWQIEQHMGDRGPEEWTLKEFHLQVLHHFGIDCAKEGVAGPGQVVEQIRSSLQALMGANHEAKETKIGPEMMRQQLRFIALSIIDARWKDHLLAMDHLKEGIGLRAYGQKDPLVEYKRESFELFAEMKNRIEEEIVRYFFLFEPMTQEEREEEERRKAREREMIFQAASRSKAGPVARAPIVREHPKVGRNEPCPCGSGKKYKKCHGLTEP